LLKSSGPLTWLNILAQNADELSKLTGLTLSILPYIILHATTSTDLRSSYLLFDLIKKKQYHIGAVAGISIPPSVLLAFSLL